MREKSKLAVSIASIITLTLLLFLFGLVDSAVVLLVLYAVGVVVNFLVFAYLLTLEDN